MKRVLTFSVFLLLLMTSVSSYCFCAHETETSVASFQRSHGCCDSNAMSHCAAHIDQTCQTERQEKLVIPSLKLQTNPEAVLAFSLTLQPDSHEAALISLTAFPKPQEALFLKNEVLRI